MDVGGSRHRQLVAAAGAAACLVVVCSASGAGGVHVSRVGGGTAVAGRPWVVRLAVRPRSFAGTVRVTATGPRTLTAPARGNHGSRSARLVFPSAGVWRLSARAGGTRSSLGAVRVRPAPLVFDQPTGVAVRPDGSLAVVESGRRRLVGVDPASGRVTAIAALVKPWGVAAGPGGSLYVSDLGSLKRIDPGVGAQVVATAEPGVEIGPVAVSPTGEVVYATASGVYRLAAGGPERLTPATSVSGSHGIAFAADGAVLVSDTDGNRVVRVDPESGAATTFAVLGHPRGLATGPDGTVYVAAPDEHRIVHLGADGDRLGTVGPRFDDPYALAAAPDGTVFAIDIGVNLVRRIAQP